MSVRRLTYTVPSEIEGEPAQVAELAIQQMQGVAAAVAELTSETFVQLRAAGIDPESADAVEEWLNTKEGQAASDLVWGAQMFVEAATALLSAAES
jgi:hypothetical protein